MSLSTASPAQRQSSSEPEKNELEKANSQKSRMWRWENITRFLGRDEQQQTGVDLRDGQECIRPGLGRRLTKKVVPGLPRPATFKRQNSERRERLTAVQPSPVERRAISVERRRALSARPASPSPLSIPKHSALEVQELSRDSHLDRPSSYRNDGSLSPGFTQIQHRRSSLPLNPQKSDTLANEDAQSILSFDDKTVALIELELEQKWILNLSMHFRDRSPREKFFVTYAEVPNIWRRVTVSCDYRDAPAESLEKDLQSIHSQREKSARIYESIRMSLPDIQFYDSVTNLKLETKDDRLHVHVTEDTNEIIPYPSVKAIQHLRCRCYAESELQFESHMSGFVYKVSIQGQIFVKKEIPGPDSVDEFLYEVNALHQLAGQSSNVIQFQGLVKDDNGEVIKGLLISFAEHGALVDLLYEMKPELELQWPRRERWARQMVSGLCEIHDAGFVQGDFTLSNIVINDNDDAQIIDINRRGCPVGWEPPEISDMIESGQRISMFIGVKSDLFQLGMTLWGLAMVDDEPERQPKPLSLDFKSQEIPEYYRDIVQICLSPNQRQRLAAKDLLSKFPASVEKSTPKTDTSNSPLLIGIQERHTPSKGQSYAAARPGSLDLPFDGAGSYIVKRHRGRQQSRGLNLGPDSSAACSDDGDDEDDNPLAPQVVAVSPGGEPAWAEVEYEGHPYLVSRDSLPEFEERKKRSREDGGALRSVGVEHVDSGLADMDLTGVGEVIGAGEERWTRSRRRSDDGKGFSDGLVETKGGNRGDAGLEVGGQGNGVDADLAL